MYYGIDIGGTKIALGVYDAQRQCLWQTRVATPHDDYASFLAAIVTLVAEADRRSGQTGSIGIGVPGIPETPGGLLYAANLPAASGHPLRADLSARLNREVRIDNDANCFALSEAWDEEFRQYPVVMGLILGTGVGGGLVINGRLLSGQNYMAGEFGHMRIPVDAVHLFGTPLPQRACHCGQSGCIENYLSGGGFAWLYQHYYGGSLSAPEIITAFYQGSEQARQHVDRYLVLLAACVASMVTAVDPHLIVLGGGLSHFPVLAERLAGQLRPYLLKVATPPRVESARHGAAGGMRGAAFLHLDTR